MTAESNGREATLVFHFEWRLTLFTLLLLPLLVSLGFWQLSRAEEKVALEARYAARASLPAVAPSALLSVPGVERADRQVWLEGTFMEDQYLLIDNRVRKGRVGFEVIALLDMAGLLVPTNLGWVAGDPARRELPVIDLPAGPVSFGARVYEPTGDAYTLMDESWPTELPAVVQAFQVGRWQALMEQSTGKPVFASEVRIAASSPYAFAAEWPVVNQSAAKHQGYALQWFTMAAVLLLAYVLRSTNLWSLLKGSPQQH